MWHLERIKSITEKIWVHSLEVYLAPEHLMESQ
jgi:hypothetical protein